MNMTYHRGTLLFWMLFFPAYVYADAGQSQNDAG
jgi:hypothetical protein